MDAFAARRGKLYETLSHLWACYQSRILCASVSPSPTDKSNSFLCAGTVLLLKQRLSRTRNLPKLLAYSEATSAFLGGFPQSP